MKLTKNDYEKAIYMYRFKNSYNKDIAEEINTTVGTIRYYFEKNGIVRAYKDKHWLYQKAVIEGKCNSEIATLANCSPKTIYDNLKRMEIKQSASKVKTRKVTYFSDFFETIDTEEKAYWLGFSMFDGGISYSKGNTRLRFQLQRRDKTHLEKFRNIIAKGASIQDGESERTPGSISYYSVLKVYSKKICEDLMNLGMIPGKKKESTFPNIPYELTSHFVRGLFDADGNIHIDKKNQLNLLIASSAYSIMETVVDLLEVEFDTTISNRYERNMLFINVGGNIKSRKVMDWIYKDSSVYLERKKLYYENALEVIDSQKI